MPRPKKPTSRADAPFASRLRMLLDGPPKVTQEQLAAVLDVRRQSVSLYMWGETLPDTDAVVKIADYFHVSSDYLLGLTDDPSRSPCAVDDLNLSPCAVQRIQNIPRECILAFGDTHNLKYEDAVGMFSDFLESRYFSQWLGFITEAVHYEKIAAKDSDLLLRTDKNHPVAEQDENLLQSATCSMLSWEAVRAFVREEAQRNPGSR